MCFVMLTWRAPEFPLAFEKTEIGCIVETNLDMQAVHVEIQMENDRSARPSQQSFAQQRCRRA